MNEVERDSRRQRPIFDRMTSLSGDAGATGGLGGWMLVAMRRHLGMMVVEALGVMEVAEAPVTVNVVGGMGQNMCEQAAWLFLTLVLCVRVSELIQHFIFRMRKQIQRVEVTCSRSHRS